jgi:hypothetical protein
VYAQVVVNRSTHRRPPQGAEPLRDKGARWLSYTYHLPEPLREAATTGLLVQVPLGASTALGVIVAISDEAPAHLAPDSIRDVAGILDPLPVVTPVQIRMASWLAEAYLAPWNQAMRLMLPPGLEARTFVVVSEVAAEGWAAKDPAGDLAPEERAALDLLRQQGGRLRLGKLLSSLRAEDPEAVLHSLADRGWVQMHYALIPPRPAPARVEYIRLLAEDAVRRSQPDSPRDMPRSRPTCCFSWRAGPMHPCGGELSSVNGPRAAWPLCAPWPSGVGERSQHRAPWWWPAPAADVADLGRSEKQAALLSEPC